MCKRCVSVPGKDTPLHAISRAPPHTEEVEWRPPVWGQDTVSILQCEDGGTHQCCTPQHCLPEVGSSPRLLDETAGGISPKWGGCLALMQQCCGGIESDCQRLRASGARRSQPRGKQGACGPVTATRADLMLPVPVCSRRPHLSRPGPWVTAASVRLWSLDDGGGGEDRDSPFGSELVAQVGMWTLRVGICHCSKSYNCQPSHIASPGKGRKLEQSQSPPQIAKYTRAPWTHAMLGPWNLE
jgi:hypothetical protein|mmetsp:Transcript_3592/g.6908  ORF Transcript_3592/g.6908 Transcript_3592/m.6908 type:complete len:241 (+) Transcript_3592:519-1241(+)